jgi:hypothetical protein
MGRLILHARPLALILLRLLPAVLLFLERLPLPLQPLHQRRHPPLPPLWRADQCRGRGVVALQLLGAAESRIPEVEGGNLLHLARRAPRLRRCRVGASLLADREAAGERGAPLGGQERLQGLGQHVAVLLRGWKVRDDYRPSLLRPCHCHGRRRRFSALAAREQRALQVVRSPWPCGPGRRSSAPIAE